MMRNITALFAMACLLLISTDAPAQLPGGVGASVGFRSDAKATLVIQGYSVVRGMQLRGQPIFLEYGKMAFENNVPPGVRYYTIYDRNQPNRVLVRDFPVPIRDDEVFFSIRAVPGNPPRVAFVPGPP